MESIGNLREINARSQERIVLLAEEQSLARGALKDLLERKETLETEAREVEGKTLIEKQKLRETQEETASLQRDILHNEEKIRAQERQDAIEELLSKQKDFWAVMEERIAYQQEQLADGLEGFEEERKDPAAIVERLRKWEEGATFGEPILAIRSSKHNFENATRDLCEIHVDGGKITPKMKQARIDVIDRLLNQDALLPYWT